MHSARSDISDCTVLTQADVEAMRHGCAVLGSGGGGDVSAAQTLLMQTLSTTNVEVSSAKKLGPNAWVALVGAVGSPTVMLEHLPGNHEFVTAVRTWEQHTGVTLSAVCALEIGGVNGLLAVNAAASLRLPIMDADGMGRAFPRLDMAAIEGSVPAIPVVLADSVGATVVVDGVSGSGVSDIVRRVLPAFGSWAAICLYGGTVQQMGRLVPGSISRALQLGRAMLSEGTLPSDREAFTGTVVDLIRSTDGHGILTLHGHDDPAQTVRIDFQEEFLLVATDGRVIGQVPDIICLVDLRTRQTVLTEDLHLGQRLSLVVLGAPLTGDGLPLPIGLDDYGLTPLGATARE